MTQTLSEILGGNLPDKAKVNLDCILVSCEMKTGKTSGKTYFNCKVGDPHDQRCTAWASFFGNSPAQFTGKRVIIDGAELGTFNGKRQISVGKFGKVELFVADFEAAPPAHTPRPDQRGTQTPPAPVRPATAPRIAQEHLPVNLPHGATVGGALARAVELYIHNTPAGTKWDTMEAAYVERIARELVEIQGRIERGEPAIHGEPPF